MNYVQRFALLLLAGLPILAGESEMARQARVVTITRDDWGIAHVHGKTDADAVFGMIYAQAEDDFNRVETNYLNAMGRLAEAEGEAKIYQDLRMKLFIDPVELRARYAGSPVWLQSLMRAFADGLNYYLLKHPETKPRVIHHFEPWMALSFTEGSIGGDIERIHLDDLEKFYRKTDPGKVAARIEEREPSGSNGIAIAPSNTANHHALLLINPHTSFFFRSELQMTSDEGLNAYGAVTWGQFFIYQGFNSHTGWMHTSSGVDAVDEYLESVDKTANGFEYRYGTGRRAVTAKEIAVPYVAGGKLAVKKFTAYYTGHGPVIREENGKWVSIRLMQVPVKALMQSYLRTKTTDYKSYRKTMELQANSSNNTVFADSAGEIAYFQGNFIPRRETSFDWARPVDGADPAAEWKGLLSIDETPHLLNPESGWLYNVNNSPWSAAGKSSPKKEDYPPYVDAGMETARGRHAVMLLEAKKDFTLESLLAAAYDGYLPWFEKTLPVLVQDWERLAAGNPMKQQLAAQIEVLKGWDRRWSEDSVATSLAVFWGGEIEARVFKSIKHPTVPLEDFVAANASSEQMLDALQAASDRLTSDFGTWRKPWGEINRFQRVNGDIEQPFNDALPSTPIGFTSSIWGSLAAFGSHPYPGTKKWYGTNGNSFVAVVEFGEKVRAVAVTAGGESGHPDSAHFNDETERYRKGKLREVYFYPEQLRGHSERQYHPGE